MQQRHCGVLSPSAPVQRVAVPSDQVHMAAPNAASCCFRQFTRQLPAQETASAANSQLVSSGVKLAADTIIRTWVLEVIRKNINGEKFVLRLYTAAPAARMWQHHGSAERTNRIDVVPAELLLGLRPLPTGHEALQVVCCTTCLTALVSHLRLPGLAVVKRRTGTATAVKQLKVSGIAQRTLGGLRDSSESVGIGHSSLELSKELRGPRCGLMSRSSDMLGGRGEHFGLGFSSVADLSRFDVEVSATHTAEPASCLLAEYLLAQAFTVRLPALLENVYFEVVQE